MSNCLGNTWMQEQCLKCNEWFYNIKSHVKGCSLKEVVMRIKPIGDKIVIEQLASDDKSAGGVLIPSVAQRKPMMGKVVAVGKGTLLENGEYAPVECVVDDTVLYGEGAGESVEVDGVEYKILRQAELLGILAVPTNVDV